MSNLNNFESNEFDNFLNLESDFTPISTSPATNTLNSAPNSTTLSSSQPAFTGPSYQYDSHRQQTGLPMGGLANTFAVNQASGLHYRQGNNLGFVMPTETLNIPLSNLDEFDFGRSQIDMNDMDFDADSPSDITNIYNPSGSTQIKSESSSQSTPIQRIYPGMHSQQAAQAKARQEEVLRQRQQQQQQPKQIAGQLPLPTQPPRAVKDPHVEESISRLLSRMRQSSTSSVDESTPAGGAGMSNLPKMKKDEDDMDDDERLLASEEGKKLSSKERRQLRNKVSARAFRSRRKEYIGQLEGEVAAKAQEANDLREQNRQLMEENNRLTDLTRMLLSSQAFSGFLQELSNSGMTMPSTINNTQPQQSQRQTRKDVSVHEASRQLQNQNQNQQQVGMTLIPETNIDLSDFSGAWNVPLPSNDFQVFSVTTLPELPVLDLESLSDKKAAKFTTPKVQSKSQAPEISFLPPPIEAAVNVGGLDILSDDLSAEDVTDLYSPAITTSAAETAQSLLESLKKPESRPSPMTVIESNNEDEADLSLRLQQMCDVLEEYVVRIDSFLP